MTRRRDAQRELPWKLYLTRSYERNQRSHIPLPIPHTNTTPKRIKNIYNTSLIPGKEEHCQTAGLFRRRAPTTRAATVTIIITTTADKASTPDRRRSRRRSWLPAEPIADAASLLREEGWSAARCCSAAAHCHCGAARSAPPWLTRLSDSHRTFNLHCALACSPFLVRGATRESEVCGSRLVPQIPHVWDEPTMYSPIPYTSVRGPLQLYSL